MFGFSTFLVYVLVALVLTRVPFIGKYFRIMNTLVHEMGHVLASLMTSGRAYQVHLFSDTSGVAYTGTSSRLSRVITSLAGYPFASMVAFAYIYMIHLGKMEWVLYSLVALLIVSLVFFVRNWFGFAWTATFLSVTLLIHFYASEKTMMMYLLVIVAVMLVESVVSAGVILWLSIKDPSGSGDAFNLKNSTYIPTGVWGLFFAFQSLYFMQLGVTYWV